MGGLVGGDDDAEGELFLRGVVWRDVVFGLEVCEFLVDGLSDLVDCGKLSLGGCVVVIYIMYIVKNVTIIIYTMVYPHSFDC